GLPASAAILLRGSRAGDGRTLAASGPGGPVHVSGGADPLGGGGERRAGGAEGGGVLQPRPDHGRVPARTRGRGGAGSSADSGLLPGARIARRGRERGAGGGHPRDQGHFRGAEYPGGRAAAAQAGGGGTGEPGGGGA